MIEVQGTPKNRTHYTGLLRFAQEVLNVCEEIGIEPILSASLAVYAYTQNPNMEVHDVDLSCSEAHFPRLGRALSTGGIDCRVRSWHVLRARKGDLKIEFDATEYWMRDIVECYELAKFGDVQFRMISIDGLQELYRRGLIDTADKADDQSKVKHQAIREKLRSLDALHDKRMSSWRRGGSLRTEQDGPGARIDTVS